MRCHWRVRLATVTTTYPDRRETSSPCSIKPPQAPILVMGVRRIFAHTLGLDHDPFAFDTAELELQVNSANPPFLTYFVDLPVDASEDSILDNLKQPGHAIVYGAAGSGKTTLRYALEAHIRTMVNRILVVSQPLGKGSPEAAARSTHVSAFLEAFAIDLFVQVLEQFENLSKLPDADLIHEIWAVFGRATSLTFGAR